MERLRQQFDAFPEVKLAVLFGSQAQGTATARSDVDVGVLSLSSLEAQNALRDSLSQAVGKWVDLVDLSTAPPLLRMEVTRSGRVLVEREPGAWAQFKARAMLDWGDWAPAARWFAAEAIHKNRERLRDGQT